MHPRIHLGHCPIDPEDRPSLVENLDRLASNGSSCLVSGVNATMFVQSYEEEPYLALLERMDVVTSDGHWLAKAGPLLGHRGVPHVPIVRLVFGLLEKFAERGGKVFLLGTKPDYVVKAAEGIESRYPGVRVVGTRDGYFGAEDEPEIAKQIEESGAELVLVGIGTPKREDWMVRHKGRFGVVIGCGGLLDIFAGATKEGPDWLRNFGLMWAYRFLQEPGRMWKRYLVGNSRFAWLVIKSAMSRADHRQALDT